MRPLLCAAVLCAAITALVAAAPSASGATLVRKDAKDLTPAERRDYVNAVLKLKRTPSPYRAFGAKNYYDLFVLWHRNVFRCPDYTAHMSPTFLPWHRYYLQLFELALRRAAGKPIAIPYWNWTDPASTRAVFRDDFMGPNGIAKEGGAVMSGPFRKDNWRFTVVDPKVVDPVGLRYLTRNFGTFIVKSLPPSVDLRRALAAPNYDVSPFNDEPPPNLSFRNALEGWRDEIGNECSHGWVEPIPQQHVRKPHEMHNRVHLWVAGISKVPGIKDPVPGTIANNTSPNDPAFFLLHANVDRIWQSWMARHGRIYAPRAGDRYGQNLNDPMQPFATFDRTATPASQLDISKLGYRYERLETAPGGREPAVSATTAVQPPTLRFNCLLQ
jgi:tyrosinase